MRKFYLLILFCLLLSGSLQSQSIVTKITQSYFRSDPFKAGFGQFLNGLINDPTMVKNKFDKKTDSTLFYLQGTYSSHSPFFFPVINSKITLSEQQEFTDSSFTEFYTYFTYQLVGYAKAGEEGRKDILEEFEKLNRRFKKAMKESTEKELKTGNEKTGTIMNYSMKDVPFYPLSLAWTSTPDKQNNMLVISVRFYMMDNKAFLPTSPYSP